jgi:hypothetical protein
MAARVQSQVRSCGICGGDCDNREGLLRVLSFPLSILIPPTAPYSSIIRGCCNRIIVASLSNVLSLAPPPRSKKKKSVTMLPTLTEVNTCYYGFIMAQTRSQWPRGLRHEPSSLARTLGSCVRIPLKVRMSICVYSVFVLGSGLATS